MFRRTGYPTDSPICVKMNALRCSPLVIATPILFGSPPLSSERVGMFLRFSLSGRSSKLDFDDVCIVDDCIRTGNQDGGQRSIHTNFWTCTPNLRGGVGHVPDMSSFHARLLKQSTVLQRGRYNVTSANTGLCPALRGL